MTAKKANLKQLKSGLYLDAKGVVYVDMAELTAEHNLPDLPEVREALLEELQREFRDLTVKLISD